MASHATRATHAPKKNRRRWIAVGVASTPILVGLAAFAWANHAAGTRLRDAIAAADRDDPAWRLADQEARRGPGRGENSADRARSALAALPREWVRPPARPTPAPARGGPPAWPQVTDEINRLDPDEPPGPLLAAAIAAERARGAEGIAVALPLADLGEGYTGLKFANDWISTLLPHIQDLRTLARILQVDAVARAEAGDGDGALDSCRAILGAARSIGDEPIVISQLVRMALDRIAASTVERVLARSTPSDAAMARVQADLAREAAHPFLLVGIRGERAGMFDLTSKITSGGVAPGQVAKLVDMEAGAAFALPVLTRVDAFNVNTEALLLDFLNRGVAIARRPLPDQPPLWVAWDRETRASAGGLSAYTGALARSLRPPLSSAADGQITTVAALDLARVALAAERSRRARGGWPDRLDDLVPAYLPAVPIDGFARAPVRWRVDPAGRSAYGVGRDGRDDGGTPDRPERRAVAPGSAAGADQVVRLIDPAARRRSARELPPSPFTDPSKTAATP